MRRIGVLFMSFALSACGVLGGGSASSDAGTPQTFYVDTGADEKSLLYNLVGRWYPNTEIKRMSDRTLTAKEWCEREPAHIFVIPEKIEVRCTKGPIISATTSSTKREKDVILVTLRSAQDAKLKQLRFQVRGPTATIDGSPCDEGPTEYARFPEYEILSREILGSQRCAQLAHEDPPPDPKLEIE
jgi:hypothetical protein